jgi:hypothetical protein
MPMNLSLKLKAELLLGRQRSRILTKGDQAAKEYGTRIWISFVRF